MTEHIWLIPSFPAIGFLINGLLGKRIPKSVVSWVGCLSVFLSFCVSVLIFIELLKLPPQARFIEKDIFDWIVSGEFVTKVGFRIDPLSIVMCLIVTGVGFLIHVYSVGYMHDDPGYSRYFTYLNLFVFMMLILVTGNNVLLMFVGWEGVGLCSYLLIGFWYEKDSASNAGKKAFIVNRIGDYGFLLGIFLLFLSLGEKGVWTLNFSEIEKNVTLLDRNVVALITLLFFIGATGKSAQIPLYVWLPDAMEGPTPVSALIHAATMVTAGVYMIARLNFLYSMAPEIMSLVAIVGVLTAMFAASIGFAQYDIKRVLAYSTISQLGYMFLGVGVGAYAAGIFHLMTHAFFKALLFLGAGSVMHALAGELDMRKMGGLKRYLPTTYWTFLVACLAIAGIPGFSGFFSKDEILWKALSSPHGGIFVYAIALVTAGMTAFYMFRLLFNVFYGRERMDEELKHHVHESPKIMTVPLVILAILSIIGGYVGIPHVLGGGAHFEHFLEPVFKSAKAHEPLYHSAALEIGLMVLSVIVALIGIYVAYTYYLKKPELSEDFAKRHQTLYKTIHNKYYVDEVYGYLFVRNLLRLGTFLKNFIDEAIIDGIVNGLGYILRGLGSLLRFLQSGYVQAYAFSMIIGAIVVMGYLLVKVIP
ncbi:MAG: NADH-quinone oxidoreductase subunit L [Desulfobacterota bacterium]|nr:NADH-quinone oxidoreductase subunit L [Thermodesulfobacteriota bacterium]